MNGSQPHSSDPSQMTSSADRMVGMDHAEVRYFTRWDDSNSRFSMFCIADTVIATTTMVNTIP